MKSVVILFAFSCLWAGPALAQKGEWSLIGSGSWITRTGETDFDEFGTDVILDIDLDDGGGVNAGVNYFLSDHISVEVRSMYAVLEGSAVIRQGDAVARLILGDLGIYPLTATLQYHFSRQGDFRWYAGAGGSIIFFGEFDTPLPDEEELDEDSGLVLNAGVDWFFHDHWTINLDGKYVPFETGTGVTPDRGLGFEPIIFSAGIRYVF